MPRTIFIPELGRSIVDKFSNKGWNVYKKAHEPEQTIEAGPVSGLEQDIKYVVLPSYGNPNDVEEVMDAAGECWTAPSIAFDRPVTILEELPRLSQVIEGKEYPVQDPRILPIGERIHFAGFKPCFNHVRVHSQWATLLPYELFIESLENLPDLKSTQGLGWNNVRTFDDIVFQNERKIIEQLQAENPAQCGHLKREGKFWHYCGLGLPEEVDRTPSPLSPIYRAHVDIASLQLNCLGDYSKCCFLRGALKR